MTGSLHAVQNGALSDEVLSQAILNSIQTRIAVVNTAGIILVVNEAWNRFARENGDPDLSATGVGINYLDLTERSAHHGDTLAAKAIVGMRRVLETGDGVFEQRYPCHSLTEERWYLMRVTPLKGAQQRGLVISHIDITTQHLAARARALRQRRAEVTRQQVREIAAIQSTDTRMAVGEPELVLPDLDNRYIALLERAFERRLFKVDDDLVGEVRSMASVLGVQSAGPRDVIGLHTRAMEHIRAQKYTSARLQVYVEEGRLLLIEIMGYLAGYYRDMILADLEQRGI
jgi:hypothetical protein